MSTNSRANRLATALSRVFQHLDNLRLDVGPDGAVKDWRRELVFAAGKQLGERLTRFLEHAEEDAHD
jgi:hypothetical protein